MLTPTIPNSLNRLHRAMMVRLRAVPDRPNRMAEGGPNRMPDKSMRTTLIRAVSFAPIQYSPTMVTRLASPSFTPGAPRYTGSNDSTYPSTSARAVRIPKRAALLAEAPGACFVAWPFFTVTAEFLYDFLTAFF